jgi:hypothetical protein
MGAHILHDPELNCTEERCGLCLRPAAMCPIYVTKGRGAQGRCTVDFTKSHCPNLVRFNYKNAAESTEKSPCSNVPTICPLCPPRSPAVWKYSLEAHFRECHRLTSPSHFPCPVGQSQSEKYGMKKVWQGRFKKRKSYYSKSKRLAPRLAVSEAHRSGLPITARTTHTQDDDLKEDNEYSDNTDDENVASEDNDNNNDISIADDAWDSDFRPEALHHGLVPSPPHPILPSPARLSPSPSPLPISTPPSTAALAAASIRPLPISTPPSTGALAAASIRTPIPAGIADTPTATATDAAPCAVAAPALRPVNNLVDNAAVQADVRPRRTRKVAVLSLNACECGITISDDEIQAGETVMKCTVEGCETVWVSDSSFKLVFTAFIDISSQFHLACFNFDYAPRLWSCDSCRDNGSRRCRR